MVMNGTAVAVDGSKIIAVQASIEGVTGEVCYWRLSGSVDLERLRAEWVKAGLDEKLLPAPPSPQAALRRAVGELADRRSLVRPLEGGKGLALVRERATGDELAYEVALRAYATGGHLTIDPPDHLRVAALQVNYAVALNEVSAADVGGWLCRLVQYVDAVALRDTGGVYFVPRHRLGEWHRIVGAVRAATGHQVFGIPAMPADETIAAVVDAVTTEAERDCALLEEQVLAGDLGERALKNRLDRADAAKEKLARYESILGQKLDGVRGRLMRARGAVAAALLSAIPAES